MMVLIIVLYICIYDSTIHNSTICNIWRCPLVPCCSGAAETISFATDWQRKDSNSNNTSSDNNDNSSSNVIIIVTAQITLIVMTAKAPTSGSTSAPTRTSSGGVFIHRDF